MADWIMVRFGSLFVCILLLFSLAFRAWKGERGERIGHIFSHENVQSGKRKRKEKSDGGKGSPIEYNGTTQVSWFAGSWFNLKSVGICILLSGTRNSSYRTECGLGLQKCIGTSFSRFDLPYGDSIFTFQGKPGIKNVGFSLSFIILP